MWERFSYYGMRALLTLYMTSKLVDGGLGFSESYAGAIYAMYVSSVWYLPLIGVDVHVHRIANRWGFVQTKTPEKTMEALQEKLPGDYWIEINALLVPFGKHICTGVRPKCSTCPLLELCQQVGVTKHK